MSISNEASREPEELPDLSAGVTVVSSEREAEVSGAVHAHHHLRNRYQLRSSFTQGHPQLLSGLMGKHGQDGKMLHTE